MRDSKFYSKVSPKNNGDFLNERERDFEPINKMTSNRKMGFTILQIQEISKVLDTIFFI